MADIFYRNITQDGDWVHVPGATSPYVIENANEDEFEVGVTVPVKTEFAGEVVVEPTAPAAFTIGMWELADAETGGTLDVTINSLPDDGGAEITDIEWTADAGENWHSSGGVVSFQITGLTDDELASIQIAAVNSVGPGPASDVKQETPTDGEVPYPAPEAEGELPNIDVWLGEPMTPLDASEDFTGTDLTYSLSPDSDPLPDGVSISSAGVISGTPTGDEDDEGVLSITIRATDPLDRRADSVFDMTVRLSEAIWLDEPTILQVPAEAAPEIRAVGTFASSAQQVTATWPLHDTGDLGVMITYHRGSAEINDNPETQGWIHVAESYVGSGGAPYANVYVKRATSDSEGSAAFSSSGGTRAAAGIIVVSGIGPSSPWEIIGINQSGLSDQISIPGGNVSHDLSLILAICASGEGSNTGVLVDGLLENSDLTAVTTVVNFQHTNDSSIFIAAGTRATAGEIGPTTGEVSGNILQARIALALRG